MPSQIERVGTGAAAAGVPEAEAAAGAEVPAGGATAGVAALAAGATEAEGATTDAAGGAEAPRAPLAAAAAGAAVAVAGAGVCAPSGASPKIKGSRKQAAPRKSPGLFDRAHLTREGRLTPSGMNSRFRGILLKLGRKTFTGHCGPGKSTGAGLSRCLTRSPKLRQSQKSDLLTSLPTGISLWPSALRFSGA